MKLALASDLNHENSWIKLGPVDQTTGMEVSSFSSLVVESNLVEHGLYELRESSPTKSLAPRQFSALEKFCDSSTYLAILDLSRATLLKGSL